MPLSSWFHLSQDQLKTNRRIVEWSSGDNFVDILLLLDGSGQQENTAAEATDAHGWIPGKVSSMPDDRPVIADSRGVIRFSGADLGGLGVQSAGI